MHPIEDLLAKLATKHDLRSERRGAGWALRLPNRGQFSCEAIVGPEVLEWCATVRRANGATVWTDWMDYTGYGESSASTLLAQKSHDIAWFVEQWCSASQIRVKETRALLGFVRSRSLEIEHDSGWRELVMFDPNR